MQSNWVKKEYQTFFHLCHIPSNETRRLILFKTKGFNLLLLPPLLTTLQISQSVDHVISILGGVNIQALKQENKQLKQDIESLRREIKRLKDEIAQKEVASDEKLEEAEALTRENKRLKREQEAKDNQLKSISKDKEAAEKAFLDEKSALEKHIQELEEENKSLKIKPLKPSKKKPLPQPAKTQPSVRLRSKPIENLSADDVNEMLKERNFFSTGEYGRPENKQGKGLNHQYEVIEREGEKLVIDHTTGLTLQQSGSPNSMVYADALKWIDDLKKKKFAGYNDWRLPTLEEAMSLMEPEKKNGGLYISEVFDRTQSWIWTADKSGSVAWVVAFSLRLLLLLPCGRQQLRSCRALRTI